MIGLNFVGSLDTIGRGRLYDQVVKAVAYVHGYDLDIPKEKKFFEDIAADSSMSAKIAEDYVNLKAPSLTFVSSADQIRADLDFCKIGFKYSGKRYFDCSYLPDAPGTTWASVAKKEAIKSIPAWMKIGAVTLAAGVLLFALLKKRAA